MHKKQIKRKKVLFTSHVANFQKFNRPFMRWFTEQGWEVHYASMGEEEILDCDKSFVVPFTRSPFSLSNIRAYKELKAIIDRENYDIIHTHTPMGSVVTRLAARAARKKGTRVIYTAHGFHFYTGAPLLNWLIYYPVERYMARHTDTLITINDEDYQRARKSFKTNVQYVPGVGVDESRFKPRLTKKQRNDLRASLGLKPDDFVMIYPAELNKNKNQIMLIDAMENLVLKNPSFHLLLPGMDSMNGYHQKLIDRKGLGKSIHLLGYRSDIPQLLQISDLSVSSSRREGLPVHIIEAMASSLPVIAISSRGVSELVVEGASGYIVPPNRSGCMRNKISMLAGDPQLRKSLGNCGGELASAYSYSSVICDLQKIYSRDQSC